MGCKAQTTAIAQLWRGFATPQTAQSRADRAARDLFSVALKPAAPVPGAIPRLGQFGGQRPRGAELSVKTIKRALDELVAAGEVVYQVERRWRRYWRGSKGQAVA